MQPLITRSDIARYRQISKTLHNDKLNEMILDAQLLDLQSLLGEKLYNSIVTSPENYIELLNGGIYEYDGISYTHYGLKMLLAYFTYARYIMFSSVLDTPFSVVEKLNSDSRQADISTKKTIYNLNKEASYKIWENIRSYLIRSANHDFNAAVKSSHTGLRLFKIK